MCYKRMLSPTPTTGKDSGLFGTNFELLLQRHTARVLLNAFAKGYRHQYNAEQKRLLS